MLLTALAALALSSLTSCAALFGYVAAGLRLPGRPGAGQRGRMRQLALAELPLFRALEPVLRASSLPFERLPLDAPRGRLESLLERAGTPLGLGSDELLALCALSGMIATGCALGFDAAHAAGPLAPLWVGLVGCALPLLRLHEQARARQHQIVRALPEAIDLTSLCMNAGLDFQAALGLLVRVTPGRSHLVAELQRVLEALQLGHTRRAALVALAERVPVPAVQDLVTAVVLAEQKGTPLASVLEIQASMLRLRRSVLAEERAARAATLLAFPLLLMLSSVMLLLFGPFLVSGLGF
jgi:tight adherence protein C